MDRYRKLSITCCVIVGINIISFLVFMKSPIELAIAGASMPVLFIKGRQRAKLGKELGIIDEN